MPPETVSEGVAVTQALFRPYTIKHCKRTPHAAESWVVSAPGTGFGMRTFPTKDRADEAIEEFFGKPPVARLTITLFADETRCHIAADKGAVPSDILDRARAALDAEGAELADCPMHTRTPSPSQAELVAMREALEAARDTICAEYCDPADPDVPHCEECRDATAALSSKDREG